MNKILSKTILLNNGINIPVFGVGTYQLKPGAETYESVKAALLAGYRHIDSAQYYDNEFDIARAILDSQVPRQEIFITSKIANPDHGYQNTMKQVDILLNKLGTNYLDLVLVHWPTAKWMECYQALIDCYHHQKIRAVGVSNFEIDHLVELQNKFEVLPVVNQIELHPGWNNTEVVNYCESQWIAIESWATMMRGYCNKIRTLNLLAEKYHKTPYHICLKWALEHGYIVFPKSVNPQRVIANCEIDDFSLTSEDIKLIDDLPQKRMGPVPHEYVKNIIFNE